MARVLVHWSKRLGAVHRGRWHIMGLAHRQLSIAKPSRQERPKHAARSTTMKGLTVVATLIITLLVGYWIADPGRSYDVHGVDVSHHQGEIAWSEFAADGVDFAYIKATEGGDWVDPLFAENWTAANATDIAVGAYHYFTLCRPGAEQATNLVATLPNTPAMLPVAVDLEYGGNCSRRPSVTEFLSELDDFLHLVEAKYGMRVVAYVTVDFYDHYLADRPPDVIWWVRSVVVPPLSGPEWTIWQYYPARRDGVEGLVDRNVLRTDLSELCEMATESG